MKSQIRSMWIAIGIVLVVAFFGWSRPIQSVGPTLYEGDIVLNEDGFWKVCADFTKTEKRTAFAAIRVYPVWEEMKEQLGDIDSNGNFVDSYVPIKRIIEYPSDGLKQVKLPTVN